MQPMDAMKPRAMMLVAALIAGCNWTTSTEGRPDTSTDTGEDAAELEPIYGECATDDDCEDSSDPCGEGYCDLHSLLCMVRLRDDDEDGHGPIEVDGVTCEGGTDCDDADPAVHPAALDTACDWIDNDCDGVAGNMDDDGDGSGDTACGEDDCDDEDPGVHPGAEELCDLVDQNCDTSLLDAPGADDDLDTYVDESCGGDDCDDEDELRNPASAEVCDGIDNDCNGSTDEATGMAAGIRVSSTTGSWFAPMNPVIEWSGSEYGIAWIDQRLGPTDLFFRRVGDSGTMASSEILVTEGGAQVVRPAVEWTGSGYGVVWQDTRLGPGDIYFAHVASDGAVLVPQQRVTFDFGDSRSPDIEWTGSEFGVVWDDDRDSTLGNEIWFVRLSAGGTKIGSEAMVTTDVEGSWGTWPGLAWTGSAYGMAWRDERSSGGFYLAIVDSGGALIDELEVATGPVEMWDVRAPIAWTGSEFGLLWYQAFPSDSLRFARVSSSGTVIGSAVDVLHTVLAPGASYHLSWTGSEYGALMMAMEGMTGMPELHAARLSGDGVLVGTPEILSFESPEFMEVSLFDAYWNTSSLALVSSQPDAGTAHNQIFLYFLADCD